MKRARSPAALGDIERRRRTPAPARPRGSAAPGPPPPVWLFDLDNTLHDASHAAFDAISTAMTAYIAEHTGVDEAAATVLRTQYWKRYGATLLGMVRHHGVRAAHFLEQTHRLPGLESRVRSSAPDRAALRRLRGRKYILTNAPRAYAIRVLNALGLAGRFDGVIAIEDMAMFGELRPKPDRRMLRRLTARLRVPASRCILVEDTLEHQKAAFGLGMRTVWMQRYLGGRYRPIAPSGGAPPRTGHTSAPEVGVHHGARRAYVYARINSLQSLLRTR